MAEPDFSRSVRALKNNFGFDQNLTETERRQLRAVDESEIAPRRAAITKIYQEITDDAEKRELASLRAQRELTAIQDANKKAAEAKRDAEFKRELFNQYDQFVRFKDEVIMGPYTDAQFRADAEEIEEQVRMGEDPSHPALGITAEEGARQIAGLAERNVFRTVEEKRRGYDELRRSLNRPETQYKLRTINDAGVTAMFDNIFSDIEKEITRAETRGKRNVSINNRVQDVLVHSQTLGDKEKVALQGAAESYKAGNTSTEQMENILRSRESQLKRERSNITYRRKEIDDFLKLVVNPVGLKDTAVEFQGMTLAEARAGYDPHYVRRVILARFKFYSPDAIKREDDGSLSGTLADNEAELRREFGLNKEALEVLLNSRVETDPEDSSKFDIRVPGGVGVEPRFKSKDDSPEAEMPYDQKVNELLAAVERAAIQDQREIDETANKIGADTLQSGGLDPAGKKTADDLFD